MDHTENMEEIIKVKAVELFSQKGFDGTTIREIARAAKCSLPMLYYYYNSKKELYEKIVYNEYMELIKKLNNAIPKGLSFEEMHFMLVKQMKEMDRYEKAIAKLSLKVLLGFEGSPEIREKLLRWSSGKLIRTRDKFIQSSNLSKDQNMLELFISIVVRVIENMEQKIFLFDEEISDEQIRKELNFIKRCMEKD